MQNVTKEEFFAYVNPRDIVLRCEPTATYWETRGRQVVGMTTPGYSNGYDNQGKVKTVYMLAEVL